MEISQICKRCGAECCKLYYHQELFAINLEPYETLKLMKKGLIHLLRREASEDSPLHQYFLLPHAFGYCFYLSYLDKSCTIHDKEIYPSACENFPFHTTSADVMIQKCLLKKEMGKKPFKIRKNQVQQNSNRLTSEYLSSPDFSLDIVDIEQRWKDYNQGETNMLKVYNSTNGSFVYIPRSGIEIKLDKIIDIIELYAKELSQKTVSVFLTIINREFHDLARIQGVFSKGSKFSLEKIKESVRNAISQTQNQFNPSLMIGILFVEELGVIPPHWQVCLKQLKQTV